MIKKPVYQIYTKELKFRVFYVCISYALIMVCSVFYIDNLFVIEVYPLVKLGYQKFIATHLIELFNSVWNLCLFVSVLFIFPFTIYHTLSFFTCGMYKFQLSVIKLYFYSSIGIWLISCHILYQKGLSYIISFFMSWGKPSSSLFFQLELEARIEPYLNWINGTLNLFSFFISLLFFTIIVLFTLVTPKSIFYFFKAYRKHLAFFLTCNTYLISPPDLWLQTYTLLLIYFLVEGVFFFSCFRFEQKLFDSSIG